MKPTIWKMLSKNLFNDLNSFMEEQRESHQVSMYPHQERISKATRAQPAWSNVELAWDEGERALKSLLGHLSQIEKNIANIDIKYNNRNEEIFSFLANIMRYLKELNSNINGFVFEPSPDKVYWAENHPNRKNLILQIAPINIGPLVEKYLWYEKSSVILTSATLTTAGDFEYLKGRLLAEDAYELALGSPFDYETSALLYLVNDIPEPNDRFGHQKAIERGLIELCKATGGKALVLFTSYDQLKRTSRAISRALSKFEIQVYEQGEGASPHTLLETFRDSDRAVLLGTRAFWEGVDVPGEALSVLAIIKLPFDVPSDPIISARSETFEDPFYQYSLPEAILRFRQGFGRLIRTQKDQGIVVVFDRRVMSKSYGRYFLDSLPQCTVRISSLADLPKTAAQWLNL